MNKDNRRWKRLEIGFFYSLVRYPSMSVISKLMEATEADTDVLRSLDSNGDEFSKFREVDFSFKCPSLDFS